MAGKQYGYLSKESILSVRNSILLKNWYRFIIFVFLIINIMNIFERQQHLQEIMKNEIERGMAFLAENAKRPEVTETASGLQYEVLVEGTGEKPSGPRANVLTHYHGTTIDGVVFDSSVLRNEPISFGLNQVITGWTEGLQLMPVGSKYKFFIPHHLAYGERGAGRDIPGGATLIFEVELLKTK